MEYRRLGKTDMDVSVLGFGASPMGNVFDVATEQEGIQAVNDAINQGINFFDVAPFYGFTLAEERLGKALVGKRKDIFLATKCGRYGLDDFDFSYNRVLQSIDESLTRLKTDYVDILQLHDIEFVDREQILNEAIPAALKVKEMGKARYIGITGLPVRYLADIARQVEIDTVLSWAHYNLLEDEVNDELVPLSKEKGFGLMNAAPLLQRILSDAPLPEWHRSPQAVKDMQPRLLALCKNYGVNLSEVAMRYAMDHPDIATTIVGMSNPTHVQQNLKAVVLRIPDGLLAEIEDLVAPVKNQMWFEGNPANNIPKKEKLTK
ncbi:oxidoreductase [Adhaeribacter aerolatus]|uniref:Oxidoreductase n=1 Tax=Adhaeribacter aerolatus TaxID=670289 RepID=A0A512B2L7_9BACT|nr:aldo/keto reductase [Adhaeribacter aerolatus]GEO06198.1 oxidoreductase [Adhaeribacter aerolatus]